MKLSRARQDGNRAEPRHGREVLTVIPWLHTLPLLALLALPISTRPANAQPAVPVSETVTHVQLPTPGLATAVLLRIRESSQRILDPPDTRILRYTLRYSISPELAAKIAETATDEGIDPELAFRLVRVESRFHTRARSPRGALGLTQVMPSTARVLDRSLRTEEEILDPRTNLRLGFRYLSNMLDRYGDVRLALLAYNRGPVAVDRALRAGVDPENGYSRKVLGTCLGSRYQGNGRAPQAV
jgi:soluble lytic murein transglycosylase-like protein